MGESGWIATVNAMSPTSLPGLAAGGGEAGKRGGRW